MIESNKIFNEDCLELMKKIPDNEFDIIYCDPPYALGSEIIIKPDGKPDYSKATDFMDKWKQPDGAFWESWFKDAYRILKHGGRVIMFGMDRQCMVNKYYAHFAGFTEQQSLYWYFMCLSDDSEILTNNGWRNIDTIKDTDKVAEFDLLVEQSLFKEPKQINKYDFDGELMHVSNKDTEQLLTLNHKCIIFEDGILKERYAYELVGKETKFATVSNSTIRKLRFQQKMRELWKNVFDRCKIRKENLFKGLLETFAFEKQKRKNIAKQGWKDRGYLFCLWESILEMEKRYSSGKRECLQSPMYSQVAQNDRGETKNRIGEQRQETYTRGNRQAKNQFYSWRKTPLLERWNYIQEAKRKLCLSVNKVCEMSKGMFGYGEERRLCYGTSVDGCSKVGQTTVEDRMCSSCESQCGGQSFGKSDDVQEQSRPQEIRNRTKYKTTLAVPSIKKYSGRVWCVETSTGAFIARRNGRVFITGNSSFPKANDLGKVIDRNAGAERTVVKTVDKLQSFGYDGNNTYGGDIDRGGKMDITAPSTELAKKYDGYKYSISPLKQTNETIMVFQKPYKTGSCLHDTLAYENNDKKCTCGALNIDGCRVPVLDGDKKVGGFGKAPSGYQMGEIGSSKEEYKVEWTDDGKGRYPAQTFVDSGTADILDGQSGISKGSDAIRHNNQSKITGPENGAVCYGKYNDKDTVGYDIGGCSKILHKCDYDKDEHDIYMYFPKVSKSEREAGLDGFEHGERSSMDSGKLGDDDRFRTQPARNVHPTLKPILLNENILKLFKTPNPQKILYPFAGAGSEIIGGVRAGFKDWVACEMSLEYVTIAESRVKHWDGKTMSEAVAVSKPVSQNQMAFEF